jgi:hypothetical protein
VGESPFAATQSPYIENFGYWGCKVETELLQ